MFGVCKIVVRLLFFINTKGEETLSSGTKNLYRISGKIFVSNLQEFRDN